jgi:prophage tail gpP-like protein
MTGVGTKGEKAPANLEPIKVDQAKVTPPETIYEAAAKQLRRFGLLHWDTPDGRIYVGAPDDAQQPLYRLVRKRGAASVNNNLLEFHRIADWSDVPSSVEVYGGQGGKDIAKARLKGSAEWADVKAVFYRPVIVVNEGAKAQEQVESQAKRERANRSKRKDAYELVSDVWSYWDGDTAIPFGLNTTADIDIDAIGGPRGRYYIYRVSCRADAQSSRTTSLSVVAPGVWEI